MMVVIPVRVLAFGSSGGSFTEDTSTVEINRAGARIALKHRVAPGDDLRLINLENFAEADFRVVGPTRLDCGQVAEWGVECAERGRNIWGIDFPAPIGPEESHASALLVCQGCKREVLSVLSLMEVQMLEATGSLYRLCDQCGQLTSWVHANIIRQPRSPESTAEPSPAPAAEPSPPPEPYPVAQPGGVERRAHKRLPIKLRILIRTYKGQEETSKTENVSKGGFAVALGSMLAVGEIVRVVCPYTAGAQDLVQKAEVRRRAVLTPGERWLYGMRYVR
ncbi:MAG: PilZ domain-containing protein [Acidobacteriia bacterium]|nr:PilZ domain-containing protein [Terriglobia bacterium]